jgi:gentisate 1,2-dioxygenase
MFVVPSWMPFRAQAAGDAPLDLFRFGDAPISEALHAHRIAFDAD